MDQLLPGTEVRARGLRWEVVASAPAGDQNLLRLRCAEGGLLGLELDLLVPFEKVEPIASRIDPTRAAALAHWRVYHQAFLLEQALGPSALLAAQPGRLQVAPYQLVPVMRALRMSRPRLLLADGVGLGKTVEAGLVLAELIARRRAHRILIVSPAGPLLQQWRQEMRDRFGLRFRVLDRDSVQEIRFASELGANPFDHEALGLISIDFAKQERVLQDLSRTHYDVVVIDEAHHCVESATREGDDSQRRRLAEVLAQQSDALLLLTATPHDGYDNHFASLIELLDPSLVDGRGNLRGELYLQHMVRRLKRHIKDPDTGKPMFRDRVVHPTAVEFTRERQQAYTELQEKLLALVTPRVKAAKRTGRWSDVLAFLSLLKRSVSSARACGETLKAIADRLDGLAVRGAEEQSARQERLRALKDFRRRLARFGVLSVEEEREHAALEAEDMAVELALAPGDEDEARREVRREQVKLSRLDELRLGLRALCETAARAEKEDPKLARLVEEIRAIRAAEPRANVLVYTEYADTLSAVVERLHAAMKSGHLDGNVLSLSGSEASTSDEHGEQAREDVCERFTKEDRLVLVSTDASAEGLNLQARCHHLIHVELPYNPNRLEQRNGRIDRFGQSLDPHVRYLYLAGTFEERLLMRLVAKFERQRAKLTFVPNTLGVTGDDLAAVKLLEGVIEDEGQLFAKPAPRIRLEAEPEDTDSVAYRELVLELDRAFAGFDKAAKTFKWLGDTGVGAEEGVIAEAAKAQKQSSALAGADLLAFLTAALSAEDGRAVEKRPDGTVALRLPAEWTFGLEEIPGYDAATRTLRLTTDVARTQDAEGHALGYLGRAHPIVRRALDRVRGLQLGEGDQQLDRRASAARGDGAEPAVLATFLGRVQSGTGRELERVIAVRLARGGQPVPMVEPAEWDGAAAPERAVKTRDAWRDHFAGWAPARDAELSAAARGAFAPIAANFVEQHQSALAAERDAQGKWLRERTEQICGPRESGQTGLFEAAAARRASSSPAERLASFATDQAIPA